MGTIETKLKSVRSEALGLQNRFYIERQDSSDPIACVYEDTEHSESYAKLFAAAPELLQALLMVVNDTEFMNGQILQSTLNKVKSAIKKATI